LLNKVDFPTLGFPMIATVNKEGFELKRMWREVKSDLYRFIYMIIKNPIRAHRLIDYIDLFKVCYL
jgi:hypothetical protein